MRLTTRGRRVVAAVALVLVTAIVVARLETRGVAVVRPPDPCARLPVLETFGNVTLQPSAMTAFKRAEAIAGEPIAVVASYRSCSDQALACQRICGDAGGCAGTCAKPGRSYHQLGAAIDVGPASLESAGVVAALKRAGWCQSVPKTDPGHFSFGGCH